MSDLCRYCDPATSKETYVTLGDDVMGVYPARVRTDAHWNGWSLPAFDYKTALKVAADTHLLAAEIGDRGDGVEFAAWDGARQAFVMSGGGRSDDDPNDSIAGTPCCGRYDIGAHSWTWMERDHG